MYIILSLLLNNQFSMKYAISNLNHSFLGFFIGAIALGLSCSPQNPNIQTPANNGSISVEVVAEGFEIPWGMTFLPNGDLLVTERNGNLFRVGANGNKTAITGLPEVYQQGQGGLLDVILHPKYDENGWIYVSYSCKMDENEGGNTALMRFKLDDNAATNIEKLFQATPNSTDGRHFGSRIVFDADGYLFLSVGERGNWDNAQMLTNHSGKIHRLNDDGSIPSDNPFVNTVGAIKSIYSYGHRNPQGMVIHPETGEIWEHEHGPKGGDEINIVQRGKNFGWPIITYGIDYNGTVISPDTAKEGMEQPILYWRPSIAPCGMAFISSDNYGDWKGDLLVGSLKFQYVNHCIIENGAIIRQEKIVTDQGRIRDIKESPDGFIYIAAENGKILKLIRS